MKKRRVLILGGGMSGLAAGVHLLDDGGAERFDVTIVCMEHRLGGKASSWRFADGRYMETGFHSLFGYYTAVPDLLARSGRSVHDPRYFTSNDGTHRLYDQGARAVNTFRIPKGVTDLSVVFRSDDLDYHGMTASQKLRAAPFFARFIAALASGAPSPSLDEYGFTAWAVAHGLDLDLTQTSWFQYIFDLTFNHPSEGSAYVAVSGFRELIGYKNAEVLYFNGPMSEVMIAPIAEHFRKLGGKVEFCTKATEVRFDPAGDRLTRLGTQKMANVVAIPGVYDHVEPVPIGGSYSLSDSGYPVGDPAPGDPHVHWRAVDADFDDVVWTLPIDSTRALLRSSPEFEVAVMDRDRISKTWELQSVASISLRLWLPDKVIPSDFNTVVLGTPQPAATLIDYANRVSELERGAWGSVIEFEGQEGLDGELTDPELERKILTQFADLPFVQTSKVPIDALLAGTGPGKVEFRRNTANHLRYVLMQPGHWKYRPRQDESPWENVVFAGDWMVGTQATASTEAAARTGGIAARTLRSRV